jgi:hypothetical protein
MDIQVEGSRTTDQAWLAAHASPVESLPPLTEEGMREADRLHVPRESYLRTAYAEELSLPALTELVERYGLAIEKVIRQRFPQASITSIRLTTWKGRLEISVRAGLQAARFEIEEDLVERLLTTGSAESLSGLKTAIEMNLVPLEDRVEAS